MSSNSVHASAQSREHGLFSRLPAGVRISSQAQSISLYFFLNILHVLYHKLLFFATVFYKNIEHAQYGENGNINYLYFKLYVIQY